MNTAMNAPAPAAPSRTFAILAVNKGDIDARFGKLAKRAAKKGIGDFAWSWGKATTAENGKVYLPLTIESARPHYAGWTFLATLSHLDGENVVRMIPGCTAHDDCAAVPALGRACSGADDMPAEYRTRGPVCDHCKLSRKRNDTYVLHHDDGRYVQVGSTCIADFLGSDEAEKIAFRAELLALAASIARGGFAGSGVGGSGEMGLDRYLAFAALAIRLHGWTSRAAARESSSLRATADVALALAYQGDTVPSDDDAERGAAATAWAEALTDEEVSRGSGDYLHNLRVIARSGLVDHRLIGLAASMIPAWERAVGSATKVRVARPVKGEIYVGQVGARVTFGPVVKAPKGSSALDASPVTLDFVAGYATEYGFLSVYKFRTANGAVLVWKTTTSADMGRDDVGKRFALVGTIKSHEDYKGEKQTVMTRCTVTEVS